MFAGQLGKQAKGKMLQDNAGQLGKQAGGKMLQDNAGQLGKQAKGKMLQDCSYRLLLLLFSFFILLQLSKDNKSRVTDCEISLVEETSTRWNHFIYVSFTIDGH